MTAPRIEGCFLWNPKRLRLVWADRAGLAFWGESDAGALGRRVFAPEDANALVLSAALAALGDEPDSVDMTLRPHGAGLRVRARVRAETHDGATRLLRVSLTEPEPAGLAGAAFEAAPRALALFDEEGAPLLRNAADRRTFGPETRAFAERFDSPEEGRALLSAAAAGGGRSAPARLAGGALNRVSVRALPGGGAPRVFLAEFMEEEALSAPGGVAGIAHDLRGPLGAIQGMADFLAASGETMGAEQRAACIDDIRTACRRMVAMIEGLVAAGAEPPDPAERFDLRSLADEAARGRMPRAEAAGLALSVSGAEEAAARGDATAALRIVGNLMDNALEHGATAGGAVRISVTAGGGNAGPALEIRDDGPGLDEAALAAALVPYGRMERAGPERAGGLGLPNARALAEAMGARLDFFTEPGAGFAARLSFPPSG